MSKNNEIDEENSDDDDDVVRRLKMSTSNINYSQNSTNQDSESTDSFHDIGTNKIELEIKEYLRLAKKSKMDLITFWKNFSHRMPYIFQIVQEVLVVPASQTSSEREFSRAKLTKSFKRYKLDDERLNKLTVVSSYSSQIKNTNKTKKKRKRSENTECDSTINIASSHNNDLVETHNIDNNFEVESENSIEIEESIDDIFNNECSEITRHHKNSMIILKPCEVNEKVIYAHLNNVDDINDSSDFFKYLKYIGDSSNCICNIHPINESNLNSGFIFELNERGKTKFRNSRKSFINDVGKYIQIDRTLN